MDYAYTLDNIGGVYDDKNKLDEALENYDRSLSIKEKKKGK